MPNSRTSNAALAALLAVDAMFIVLSALQGFQVIPISNWHVSADGGVAERWQYLKWGAMVIACLTMAVRTRSAVYLAWALVCFYFLLDDSLIIHERLGEWIAATFDLQPAFRLRAQDFGELAVTGGAAIILFGTVAVAYAREARNEPRQFTHHMMALVVVLVFFGVGVDMADIMVPWPTARILLELVEDGGEMAAASFMTVYVASSAMRLLRQHAMQTG